MHKVPQWMNKVILKNRTFLRARVLEYNQCVKLAYGMVDKSQHALNMIVSHEDGSNDFAK